MQIIFIIIINGADAKGGHIVMSTLCFNLLAICQAGPLPISASSRQSAQATTSQVVPWASSTQGCHGRVVCHRCKFMVEHLFHIECINSGRSIHSNKRH